MAASLEVSELDAPKRCPICGNPMHAKAAERVSWTPRTSGERHVFSCARCGVSQSVWDAVPQGAADKISRYP
jgi:hypothetical protein